MTPIYAVVVLIAGGAIAAEVLDRRRCRAAARDADRPLTHPSKREALLRFREGPMRSPENTGLDPHEECAWEAIKAAESAVWITQAIKGRREGERG